MRKFLLFYMLFSCFFLYSVTLWENQAGDIYARKIRYQINDSIKIKIDEKSKLKYQASSKSIKSTSLNSDNGELSGVFTLIPSGDVNETKESSEKDELEYLAELQGRVVAVKDNCVTIFGTKKISIDNKISLITIRGDAALKDLSGNSIRAFDLMDEELTITTAIENLSLPVNESDFDESSDSIVLTEGKKKELLVKYLNKMLNVIF